MNLFKWLSDRVYDACAAGFLRFAVEVDPDNPPPSLKALKERAADVPQLPEAEETASKGRKR